MARSWGATRVARACLRRAWASSLAATPALAHLPTGAELLNTVAAATAAGALPQPGGLGGALLSRYQALVAAGTLKHDAHQASCVARLDRLCAELGGYAAAVEGHQAQLRAYQVQKKS